MVVRATIESKKMGKPTRTTAASLIICQHCNLEMTLLGIESENIKRDLYTFECEKCARLEVRGVRIK